MKHLITILTLSLSCLLSPLFGQAEDARVGDPWPLDTCVVSGEKLGSMGDPIVQLHEGREVRFCCKGCLAPFTADPDRHLEKADVIIKALQRDAYPLKTCIVKTANALPGAEDDRTEAVIGNRLFIFCCPMCEAAVRADPAKYIATLNEAVIAAQLPTYPVENCVVGGGKLGSMGEPVNRVVAGTLVRLCCAGCIAKLEATPGAYLEKLRVAKIDAAEEKSPEPVSPSREVQPGHEGHGH